MIGVSDVDMRGATSLRSLFFDQSINKQEKKENRLDEEKLSPCTSILFFNCFLFPHLTSPYLIVLYPCFYLDNSV
jgi:hypothetical protein